LRILHITAAYPPAKRYGGPVWSVSRLAEAQVAAGHCVTVLSTDMDFSERLDVPRKAPHLRNGVYVTYFGVVWPTSGYNCISIFPWLLTTVRQYDVVHLHGCFLFPTVYAAWACVLRRVPFVWAPRGVLVRRLIARKSRVAKRTWLALLDRPLLRRAQLIQATSEDEAREVRELNIRNVPVEIIENGVDDIGEARKVGAVPNRVVFLGRINWKKGLDRFIDVVSAIPDAEGVIAGNDESGFRADIREYAERRGVSDRVTFLGPVYGAAKWRLLSSASVVLVPSYHENFGNVVLEALVASRPVVTTPDVGAANIVEGSGGGTVAEDVSGLVRAVDALLDDPLEANCMGHAGREYVLRFLTWAKIAERVLKLYRRALTSP